MKRFVLGIILISACAAAQNKGTPIATTGMVAPMLYDSGDPVALGYPCDLSHLGIPFYNMSGGPRPISVCDGAHWIQATAPVSPPVSAVVNSNGSLTFTKADGTTWTTAAIVPMKLSQLQNDIGAGATGPQGNPGTNGSNGTNAANPNFSFSASGLSSGSTPTASVTGTYPNLTVALGIPAGQAGSPGAAGTNGTNGTAGVAGPAGPSGTTYIGTATLTQTAAVALALGPRTVTVTLTGVVAGGTYFVGTSSAPPAGYGVYANGVGSAANTLQVTVYAPALAIGASYSIPVGVWRMN